MTICIITMGGTIGGVAIENINRSAFKHKNIVADWIKQKFNNLNLFIFDFCNKDSREISDQDLKRLTCYINRTNFIKYIITQGTDTAIVTGRYLQQHLLNKSKCVIITGSFSPLGRANSDAAHNLINAITSSIRAGVSLMFNDQRFNPQYTGKKFYVKDVMQSEGRFRLLVSAQKKPASWFRKYGPIQGDRYAERKTYSW